MPSCMECKTLVYSRRFCPWFDKNIDHCWGRQVKHMVIRVLSPRAGIPLQRFGKAGDKSSSLVSAWKPTDGIVPVNEYLSIAT